MLVPHSLEWRGGFGDQTVTNRLRRSTPCITIWRHPSSVINQVKEAKNGPVSSGGQYSFAGLEDNYFAAVFLPGSKSSVEMTTFSDPIPDAAGKDEPRVGASVGGDGLNIFSFTSAPKTTTFWGKWIPSWSSWSTGAGSVSSPSRCSWC